MKVILYKTLVFISIGPYNAKRNFCAESIMQGIYFIVTSASCLEGGISLI